MTARLSFSWRASLALLPFLAITAFGQTPTALDPEALFEAARTGDRATVVALLDRGLDVNVATRYGTTALIYAADKGQLDIVRLLVERGANVNAADSFFGVRAIDFATYNGHTAVALYLLAHGAKGAADVLEFGIGAKNMAMVEAALATNDVSGAALQYASALADQGGDAAIAALVKKAAAAKPATLPPLITLDSAALSAFGGRYINATTGAIVTVTVAGGRGLALSSLGQPTLDLQPFEARQFRAANVSDLTVVFSGRAGLVERMMLVRGATVVNYEHEGFADATSDPALPADASSSSPASKPVAPSTAVAPRAPARPWPAFRGANGSGIADGQGAVADWDVATGRNVRWKTAIPGLAITSPIIWENKVIAVSAASPDDTSFRTGLYGETTPVENLSRHSWRVHMLDLHSGKELWNREVFSGAPRTKRHPKSSQANATPVTDGRHIVALFGSIGLMVCYDMNGDLLWKKDLGTLQSGSFLDPTYEWGHGNSPVIYKSAVIVQADQFKGSFLAAFNLADGREVWRTPRADETSTWGTPAVLSGPKGDELVTNGTKIRAYDPNNGKLLWTLAPNSEIAIGSPVVQRDVVYVTGGYPPIRPVYAVRAGARGDISLPAGQSKSDAVLWSHDRDGTYISTPIVYRDELYTLNHNGILTAYDAATGAQIFRARVGGGGAFSASPVAADGKLYIASEDGDVFVVQAGRTYVELGRQSMGEVVMSTPAISDGVIVIRTLGHLWGIGASAAGR